MECKDAVARIRNRETALGLEIGSTRIKAVLIDRACRVLASGSFGWENSLENGLWTYRLEDAVAGMQACYAALREDVRAKYGEELTGVGSIGISGMMHGYLPLNQQGEQLAPFLTWRNTNASEAAEKLTELFQYKVPMRWSIAQLYQAILQGEAHVAQLGYLTTLSGYIHYRLSGQRVLGACEASGMFPLDQGTLDYDVGMLKRFEALIADRHYPWTLRSVMPRVLVAGQSAGVLTAEGALLLDPTGMLQCGIPMAPPEGDAGTGMVGTNSVRVGAGNVSAGTSVFSMVVLERRLSKPYRDIDIVTTPTGRYVAMVQSNNGTTELNSWMRLFESVLSVMDAGVSASELYERLFQCSLEASPGCGGVLSYNYLSGEPVTGCLEGRPLLLRRPDSDFTLGNFMRAQIYAVFAPMVLGMKTIEKEQVQIRCLTGHGGLFKTVGVAQRYLAAALDVPVAVLDTAAEGGAYGMALLAAYLLWGEDRALEAYLDEQVFAHAERMTVMPDEAMKADYAAYLQRYQACLDVEYAAIRCWR